MPAGRQPNRTEPPTDPVYVRRLRRARSTSAAPTPARSTTAPPCGFDGAMRAEHEASPSASQLLPEHDAWPVALVSTLALTIALIALMQSFALSP